MIYKNKTKVIVTVGPSTNDESALRRIKDKGVDFVRVNMSHSEIADLERCIALARKVGLPFIVDTEGSQVRTGDMDQDVIHFKENAEVRIWNMPVTGDSRQMSLRPSSALQQLEEGDLLHIDFDTLVLRVADTSTCSNGYITAWAISEGFVGRNKAVVIDPVLPKKLELPPLTEKDYQAIELGLAEGIEHIAVSFVRSGAAVEEVREATRGRMRIISKIECVDALQNLDEIIRKSDSLLIDRGDLSKEIPVERIPFTQKVVIHKARAYDTGVFVATNLLETMIEKRKPTRAEVQDVVNTIVDGAAGLTLSAETAIGKHPMQCINMLNKLIRHAESVAEATAATAQANPLIESLETSNYLQDVMESSSLIAPHGGRLVDRVLRDPVGHDRLDGLKKLKLDSKRQVEVQQIALGTYSPLEGFMNEEDFQSVLNTMRLADGTAWPLPILLDVSDMVAGQLTVGEEVALVDEGGDLFAFLQLEEKYRFDKEETARKVYGTTCLDHPGVRMIHEMQPVLLAGKIDLVKRKNSETREYELSPRQVRRLFDERNWASVLGFHTRNVIHKGHEFIQLDALERTNCDGLFVHPVVGEKKPGDFHTKFIVKSYVTMMGSFYPKDKVVLAGFSTFSRYAGPREALFTAICRKNFGCSHFIVGRDHTGTGNYYAPNASQKIFDRFPELEIEIIKFDEVLYSRRQKKYVHNLGRSHEDGQRVALRGTEARALFESGKRPPTWLMRPEISEMILDAMSDGEQVFVSAN